MKFFSTIFLCAIIFAFSQEDAFDTKIDAGIGGLKINAELKSVKNYLTPLAREKMWSILYDEGMITSIHSVNISKFPVKAYYGLVIERIEVQMQAYSNNEGETVGEDIFQFELYMKMPADAAYDKLIDKAVKEMGEIRTYSIEESSIGSDEEIQSPNWFTHTTIVTIAGKKAVKTVNGKKYIWVKYQQGYGG